MAVGRSQIRPLAVVAVVAVAVAILTTALLAPGRAVPDPIVAVAGARDVVCPVGDPVFGQTTVQGVGETLVWSELGGEPGEAVQSILATDPASAIVVTGDQSMGMLSTAVQRTKLVGLLCSSPTATGWWDGVWVTEQQQSALIVTNMDASTATVTLTALGEIGQLTVPGFREIPIGRYETRIIDLNTFFTDAGITSTRPVALTLKADSGRVVAYLRSQGDLGEDWRQTSVAPATDLVVPGVPSGGDGDTGGRYLFVTNHGDRRARVQILGQTAGAAVPIAGDAEIEGSGPATSGLSIAPHSTMTFELTQALAGEAIGLILHSLPYTAEDEAQPITAALVVTGEDMASVAAQPALTGGQLVPVLKDSSLTVTNPGAAEVVIALTYRDEDGFQLAHREVQVNPGVLTIPLEGESGSVQVEVEGDGARVVLVIPALGDVPGLIFAPLGAGGATGLNVQIGFDPTLG
jgi:hypothetical protein